MNYNLFYVFFEDGSSIKVEYPDDWTAAEVASSNNVDADSVQGPYPVI
ncbi:hypothetical protein [Pseudomonas phage Astolliot]|nr:hypothetical protein [Pseudomonas phage Astolliot]